MLLLAVFVQIMITRKCLLTFRARKLRFLRTVPTLRMPFQCRSGGEYFAAFFANIVLRRFFGCRFNIELIEMKHNSQPPSINHNKINKLPSGTVTMFLAHFRQKQVTAPSIRKVRPNKNSFAQSEQLFFSVTDSVGLVSSILDVVSGAKDERRLTEMAANCHRSHPDLYPTRRSEYTNEKWIVLSITKGVLLSSCQYIENADKFAHSVISSMRRFGIDWKEMHIHFKGSNAIPLSFFHIPIRSIFSTAFGSDTTLISFYMVWVWNTNQLDCIRFSFHLFLIF